MQNQRVKLHEAKIIYIVMNNLMSQTHKLNINSNSYQLVFSRISC